MTVTNNNVDLDSEPSTNRKYYYYYYSYLLTYLLTYSLTYLLTTTTTTTTTTTNNNGRCEGERLYKSIIVRCHISLL